MALTSSFGSEEGYVHIGRHKTPSEEAVNYALEVLDAAAESEYASALFAFAWEELDYTERDARLLVNRFLQWKRRRLTTRITGEE